MSKHNNKYPIKFLAFDLGASSGRAFLGNFKENTFFIKEIHRFSNPNVLIDNTIYWDIFFVWNEIIEGLKLCSDNEISLSGIAIDTWGVDFGLLDKAGKLMYMPVCYRDKRTETISELIEDKISEPHLYKLTGMGYERVSTFTHLVSMVETLPPGSLNNVGYLLRIPDLYRFFLSGQISCDITNAGSTQLLNLNRNNWCKTLLKKFKIPPTIMPPIVPAASVVGNLSSSIQKQTGLPNVPVIAVAGHDTASATVALPFVDEETAFISSGTWAMVGKITKCPIISDSARISRFVNYSGFNENLFMKGLMGFYLFECMLKELKPNKNKLNEYDRISENIKKAKPFSHFIDPNDKSFFNLADSPQKKINKYFLDTSQSVPKSNGQLYRTILESLCYSNKYAFKQIEEITKQKIARICVVGGGVKNSLYCQMLADATNKTVIAGPAEASIIGNLCLQALATGILKDRFEIRDIIRHSFNLKTYKPKKNELWEKHWSKYLKIAKNR